MQTPKKKQQERANEFLDSVQELKDEARMRYDVCIHNHVFAVSLHDLKEWLRLRGMVPFGLETLLNDLETQKKIQHETDFKAGPAGVTGWMVSSGEAKAREGKYIIIELIKEYAEELMRKIRESDRSAPGSDHIQPLIPDWSMSNDDLKMILLYLEKIKRLVIIQLSDGTVGVKINAQTTQVTETDKGILSMQVVLDMLEDQVEKLTSNIDSCVHQASELLKNKNRARALSQLKKKKMLQDVLDKRIESIHKLQQILLSIDSATTNNQVMEAFETGVQSLKTINKQYSVDKVGEIMDDLSDALADQSEIDSAISANFESISNSNFDESELESELAALVSEDEKEKAKKREEEEKAMEIREREKEKERQREKEKAKQKEKAEFNEEDLERDLENLEKEENEAKEEKRDESVDELADLVGGVKLDNNDKSKNREEPMLA